MTQNTELGRVLSVTENDDGLIVRIELNERAWANFTAALERPPRKLPRLAALFARRRVE